MYALSDYDYILPEDLIAQIPESRRDESRLLRLNRTNGRITHHRFDDLVDLLRPSDVLVINDTRVVPARLVGRKPTGGRVEILLLKYPDDGHRTGDYPCLVKTSKSISPDTEIAFGHGLTGHILGFTDGVATIRFHGSSAVADLIDRTGGIPLPPYIRRNGSCASPDTDREAYQTVYARRKGAVAAPTAGLHFTQPLLDNLQKIGVTLVPLTLHVGYGTFRPVRARDIRHHRMHSEYFDLSEESADLINASRGAGRRIIAVGTTSVRTLEYLADEHGRVVPAKGQCDLFLYPGRPFRCVDAMITNFHLPRSTLLMLVAAFAGRETILDVYAQAIQERYRFYSYGDAMLIE